MKGACHRAWPQAVFIGRFSLSATHMSPSLPGPEIAIVKPLAGLSPLSILFTWVLPSRGLTKIRARNPQLPARLPLQEGRCPLQLRSLSWAAVCGSPLHSPGCTLILLVHPVSFAEESQDSTFFLDFQRLSGALELIGAVRGISHKHRAAHEHRCLKSAPHSTCHPRALWYISLSGDRFFIYTGSLRTRRRKCQTGKFKAIKRTNLG